MPLILKSRVYPVAGWLCGDRSETPTRAGRRWLERRSEFGSGMEGREYHNIKKKPPYLHKSPLFDCGEVRVILCGAAWFSMKP